jgi:hypothetical protein
MFDVQTPNLTSLFEQLGLTSDSGAIDAFIESHQLPEGMALEDAGFWQPGQRQFLCEARQEDAAWSTVVDDLLPTWTLPTDSGWHTAIGP